jgi:hypothetical protein
MATASFNGQDLGLAPVTHTRPAPYRVQRNYFAGADGPQTIQLGKAGTEIAIESRIYAADAGSFAALYQTFIGLMDGNAYPLVDTYGTPWPATELVGFGPAEERVRQSVQLGFSLRCEFRFFSHT